MRSFGEYLDDYTHYLEVAENANRDRISATIDLIKSAFKNGWRLEVFETWSRSWRPYFYDYDEKRDTFYFSTKNVGVSGDSHSTFVINDIVEELSITYLDVENNIMRIEGDYEFNRTNEDRGLIQSLK